MARKLSRFVKEKKMKKPKSLEAEEGGGKGGEKERWLPKWCRCVVKDERRWGDLQKKKKRAS